MTYEVFDSIGALFLIVGSIAGLSLFVATAAVIIGIASERKKGMFWSVFLFSFFFILALEFLVAIQYCG